MVGNKNVSKKEEIDDLLPVTRSRPGSASTGNRRYVFKRFYFFNLFSICILLLSQDYCFTKLFYSY
jgi:hypothetical protein